MIFLHRRAVFNCFSRAVDRLSPTEKDIIEKTFGVTSSSIATKAFGLMSTAATGFVKPKLSRSASVSTLGSSENNFITVENASTLPTSSQESEPSPMISSYKNLDKVRKMLLEAAKSIPKRPTYESEELDRNLIACLAVYECRIKQKGIQFITENYHVSRGDVQRAKIT